MVDSSLKCNSLVVSFTPGFSPVFRNFFPGGNRFNGLRVRAERQSQNR